MTRRDRPANSLPPRRLGDIKSRMQVVAIAPINASESIEIPVALNCVPAGFPSPAEDHADTPIDLAALLVKNKAATFLMRVRGDSMVQAGIFDNSLIVVDRSAEAKDGAIIVAAVAGSLTVKRLRRTPDRCWLEAANSSYKPIEVSAEDMIVGVVRHTIRSF